MDIMDINGKRKKLLNIKTHGKQQKLIIKSSIKYNMKAVTENVKLKSWNTSIKIVQKKANNIFALRIFFNDKELEQRLFEQPSVYEGAEVYAVKGKQFLSALIKDFQCGNVEESTTENSGNRVGTTEATTITTAGAEPTKGFIH